MEKILKEKTDRLAELGKKMERFRALVPLDKQAELKGFSSDEFREFGKLIDEHDRLYDEIQALKK
jgi:hypothetical protein